MGGSERVVAVVVAIVGGLLGSRLFLFLLVMRIVFAIQLVADLDIRMLMIMNLRSDNIIITITVRLLFVAAVNGVLNVFKSLLLHFDEAFVIGKGSLQLVGRILLDDSLIPLLPWTDWKRVKETIMVVNEDAVNWFLGNIVLVEDGMIRLERSQSHQGPLSIRLILVRDTGLQLLVGGKVDKVVENNLKLRWVRTVSEICAVGFWTPIVTRSDFLHPFYSTDGALVGRHNVTIS